MLARKQMPMDACGLQDCVIYELFEDWIFIRIREEENNWKRANKTYTFTGQSPSEKWKTERWHAAQRKAFIQPGRLVMKIQSVTLNREVSLAMNLLGGRQRHRQRLIPTEERGLQDTAMLKITTWPLFLCTWRHDWNASYICAFNFHLQVWTQFCGQTATGKSQSAAPSIIRHSAMKSEDKSGKMAHREVFRK